MVPKGKALLLHGIPVRKGQHKKSKQKCSDEVKQKGTDEHRILLFVALSRSFTNIIWVKDLK